MTADDDILRIIGSGNITETDIKEFVQSLKKPFDMRGKIWKLEDNAKIEKLQNISKAFYEDLKNDKVISLYEIFESPIDPLEVVKQTRNVNNIYHKLGKTDVFTGDEQFLILCSLYLFWVEQIRRLFLQYIERIYYTIPIDVRKKENIQIPKYWTLVPVINLLKKYKNGKYLELFSDINVDLRNSIGHFNFHFGETDITYDGKTISGKDFLILFKWIIILFPILHSMPQKVFASEAIEELRKSGYDVK